MSKKKKIFSIHKTIFHAYPPSVYVALGPSQICACGHDTLVSNQPSKFCFLQCYTYRRYSSSYTAYISSHLGSCALTCCTQNTKACIICQTKWQCFALFIKDTPGVYNRCKNRNRCNSHRKHDMTMASGSH